MGGMPYIVEKGPVYSVYESYLNGPLPQRLAMLANLADPHVPSWQAMPLRTSALDDARTEFQRQPDYHLPDELENHARHHWRGNPTFDPDTCTWHNALGEEATGWWTRWSGPADAILREVFIRAIEVSLGQTHMPRPEPCGCGETRQPHRPLPEDECETPRRRWPIEILWVCGAPTLQGWVTWRRHGDGEGDGQVTLLLTTPAPFGTGYDMYLNPTPDTREATGLPDYLESPGGSEADVDHAAGMWVIGARETRAVPVKTFGSIRVELEGNLSDVLVRAEIEMPISRYETVDPAIVTVRPNERDGGVLNEPRAYVNDDAGGSDR